MRNGMGRRILNDLANTPVEIINKERSGDGKDDYGDYNYDNSTLSANVVVTRTGGSHTPDPSGAVIETQADYLVSSDLTVTRWWWNFACFGNYRKWTKVRSETS